MDYASLPEEGMTHVEIESVFDRLRATDRDARSSFGERWLNDRGLLLDDGALEVAKAAHMTFFTKNNSHSVIMGLERELVSWTLNLLNAQHGAAGTLTSGGSESLFLATAAAFANFQKQYDGNKPLEAVIPQTGYPTFEKYSQYLGYKVKRVAVDENFKADPEAVEAAINDQTFMILGSFSSWAHGCCDPIPALADIARSRGIWLHVDACVGGMLAPFAHDLGRQIPTFDFSLPGVSSISVDFHKYGYSSKGVSGIFFQNHELASSQTFSFDEWAAGLYRSPVFTGTRSGGAIASAWAVARYLGRKGYQRRTAQVLKARDAIVNVIESSPDLMLLGSADLGTVAFGSNTMNISLVAECLREMGWAVNDLQQPDGIQLVLGPIKDVYIDAFSADLTKAVEAVRGTGENPIQTPVVYSDEVVSGPGSILGKE